MDQFVRYVGALMKHLKGVLAAIIGSLVFASPSWIRPALSPDWQRRMDLLLTFDVNTVRRAYLLFIPVGLFWATYRAWQAENNARIAAERATPEELKNRVETLTGQLAETRNILASRWQSLTEQQRTDFVAALKEFGITPGQAGPNLLIFPDFTHHDAVELSHTFGRLCAEAYWNAPTYSHSIGVESDCPPGITINAKTDRPDVQTFIKALERAQIPYELKSETRAGVFQVTIGRRIP